MEDSEKKKFDWKAYKFPTNITYSGRVTRLFIGTGLFTFGFWKRRPVFLFFGITELLSAATGYTPIYDGYGIYCKRRGIANRLEMKQSEGESKEELKEE
ncbi:hypothetical protein WA556_002118 [Blastocystis sp. ATCC 50177/Nand II]